MEVWAEIVLVAVPIVLLLLAIVLTLRRRIRRRRRRPPELPTGESMQSRLARLHGSYEKDSLRFHPLHSRSRQRDKAGAGGGTGCLNGGVSHQDQEVFHWEDHPVLAADAAENGWARFYFLDGSGSGGPPAASLLGRLCVGRDGEGNSGTAVEGTWELPLGSSEFMQVVRLNPAGITKKPAANAASAGDAVDPKDDASVHCFCLARMNLPLPGPPAGTGFFPPDGYFEITILYIQSPDTQSQHGTRTPEADAATPRSKPDSLPPPAISVGLTSGAAPENRLPGSYPGSIRMDSDGSLHLDGIELVPPSTKTQSNWAHPDRVVGCGYSPGRKRVWFTADGDRLHDVHCRAEAFRHPLYPTLAASEDVMVLVNMGQQKFRYAPANAQRSASPCFEVQLSVGAGGGSVKSAGGVGDSGELFSIGRVDPRWQERGGGGGAQEAVDDPGAVRRSDSCYSCTTIGDDSELFEIDLKAVRK